MTQAAHAEPAPPTLPSGTESIALPQGTKAKVFLVGHATGVQIYTCNGNKDWGKSTPRADLFGDNGQLIATHFGGPTWKAKDGSTVVGSLEQAGTPTGGPAAIPWLRLKATSTAVGLDGDRMVGTTYIQRTATTGGLPPAAAECTVKGTVAEIPYTADYYFYKETAGG